jgi:filamentous hemagglutinin family protein
MTESLKIKSLPGGGAVMLRGINPHKSLRFAPKSLSFALASAFNSAASSLTQAITGLSITLAGLASAQAQSAASNLPQGGVAVHGTANIVQNGNTLNVTTTNGAGGNTSAINWQSFNIGPGHTTNINQPSAASTSLNRVVSNVPTQIHGALNSNGQVIVVNQNGIAVGSGGVVDTAGFTASTLNITDADYKAGRMRFEGNALSGGVQVDGVIRSRNGNVVLIAPQVATGKDALIKAENGNVILGAGQSVELTGRGLEGVRFIVQSPENKATNLGNLQGNAVGIFGGTLRHSGSITAQTATLEGGKIVLRALGNVTIERDGASGSAPTISANGGVNAAGVAQNGGSIRIESTQGNVSIGSGSAISANAAVAPQVNAQNMPLPPASARGGAIEIIANGAVNAQAGSSISATGYPGGSIRIYGAQEARVGSSINASAPSLGDPSSAATAQLITISGAAANTGGSIQILSPGFVSLETGAQLLASGDAGGGSILVGGDYQGANAEITNAFNTNVSKDVLLEASARVQGDGGRIVVWADNNTYFGGNLVAKGGEQGGNGGFGETSGKNNLYFRGRADLSARRGRMGTLLLDPDEILIQGGVNPSSLDPNFEISGQGIITKSGAGLATIYESDLENINGDVFLEANNKISFSGNFNYTSGISGFGLADTLAIKGSLSLTTKNDIAVTPGSSGIFLSGWANSNLTILAGGDINLLAGENAGVGQTNVSLQVGGGNGFSLVSSSGNVQIQNLGGSVVISQGVAIDVASGDIEIEATGDIFLSSLASSAVSIQANDISIRNTELGKSIFIGGNGTQLTSIAGDLELRTDSLELNDPATFSSTGGSVIFSQTNQNRGITIGGTGITQTNGDIIVNLAAISAVSSGSELVIGSNSNSGNITIASDGVTFGNVKVSLITGGNGNITQGNSLDEITMSASSKLYVETKNGNIDLGNDANTISRISAQSQTGSIIINGGAGDLTVDSIQISDEAINPGTNAINIKTSGNIVLNTDTSGAGITSNGADIVITPGISDLALVSGGGDKVFTINSSSNTGAAGTVILPEIAAGGDGLTLNIVAQNAASGLSTVTFGNVSNAGGAQKYLENFSINTTALLVDAGSVEVTLPSAITANTVDLKGSFLVGVSSPGVNITTLSAAGSVSIEGVMDTNIPANGNLDINSSGSVTLNGSFGLTNAFNNVTINAAGGNASLENASISISEVSVFQNKISVSALGDINVGTFTTTGADTRIILTAVGSVLNTNNNTMIVGTGDDISITAGGDIGSSTFPILVNGSGMSNIDLSLELTGSGGSAFVKTNALVTNLTQIESGIGEHSFDVRTGGTNSQLVLSANVLGDDNITLTSDGSFNFGANSINAKSVSITTKGQITTDGTNVFDIGATNVTLAASSGIGTDTKFVAINADTFDLSVQSLLPQDSKIFVRASAQTGTVLKASQFALNTNNLAELNLEAASDVTEVLINGNQLGNAIGVNVNIDAGSAPIRLKPDSGQSLTFDGAGQFVLASSGNVIVDSTVIVNNTLAINAPSQVTANGQLTGTGTFDNAGQTLSALSGSTITPGTPNAGGTVDVAGVLNVTGNVDFQTGSLLRIYVDSAANYSKLNVTGATTSLGGSVRLVSPGQLPDGAYVVIEGSSAVSGSMVLEPISGIGLSANIIGSQYEINATAVGAPVNVWLNVTGDWDNPANWSLGRVPVNGDVVVINPTGAQTVTVDENINLNNYTLNFSGADDTILITTLGNLNILSGATLDGVLSVSGGTLNLFGANTVTNLSIISGTANIGGAIGVNNLNWTGGNLRLDPGGVFTHNVAGTLNVGLQSTLIYSGGSLTNKLNNQGTVLVLSGTTVSQELDSGTAHAGKFDISLGGTLTVSGNATLSNGGAVSAINGGGTLEIDAGSSLTLNDAVNFQMGTTKVKGTLIVNNNFTTDGLSFEGAGVLNGNDSSITVLSSFADTATAGFGTGLKSVNITQDTGNLLINRDLTVSDALFLTATNGRIETLSAVNGVNAKSIVANAQDDVTLRSFSTNATTISAKSTQGNISLGVNGELELDGLSTAAGKLAQITAAAADPAGVYQKSAINTQGDLQFNLLGSNLTLSDAGNVFGSGIFINQGGQVVLAAATTNTLKIAGNMATLNAVGGNVQLGNAGFGLDVSFNGAALSVNASGGITQGGVLNIAGKSNLDAQAGLIALDSFASTYGGSVRLITGGAASINSNGALNLEEVSAQNLTVIANGDITQVGKISVSGTTQLNATGKNISLLNTTNDFGTVRIDSANFLQLQDQGDLVINGTVVTNADITFGNKISTTTGFQTPDLNLTVSQANAIVDMKVDVSGSTTLNYLVGGSYQDFIYANQNTNTANFAGNLVASGSVTLSTAGAVILPRITAQNLEVNSGGAVTQTADTSLRINDQTTINATGNNITLTSVDAVDGKSNDIRLFTATGKYIALVTTDVVNPEIVATGQVSINALGINQTSDNAIVAAGVDLRATQNIDLIGNNKLGVADITSLAGNIRVNDVGSNLTVNTLIASGTAGIAVTSGGSLTAGQSILVSSQGAFSQVSLKAASIGSQTNVFNVDAGNVSIQATSGDAYVRNNRSSEHFLTGATAVGTLHYETATGDGYAVTGNVSAANVELLSGGNLSVGSANGAVSITGSNSVLLEGFNVRVSGGNQNGASTNISSSGKIVINAFGNFVLEGGSAQDTFVKIVAAGPVTLNVGASGPSGTVNIVGGSGNNAYALLDPTLPGSVLTINSTGDVNLQGGAGVGSYAAVQSVGDILIIAPSLNLLPGTGLDADAVVVSTTGNTTLPSICTGCLSLATNPLGNGSIEAGVYNGAVVIAPIVAGGGADPVVGIVQIGTILDDLVNPDDRLPGQDPEIVVESCP